MNDYLGQLVGRSLNLATVVQPRPVLLFEPPQKIGGLMFGQDFGPALVDVTSASDEAEIRPALVQPSGRPSTGLTPERRPLTTGSQVAPSMPEPLPANVATPAGPLPGPSTDPSWAVPVTSQPVPARLDRSLNQPAPSPPQAATFQTSAPIAPANRRALFPRRAAQQPDADQPILLPAVDTSAAEAAVSRSAVPQQRPVHPAVEARVVGEPGGAPGQHPMQVPAITVPQHQVHPDIPRVQTAESWPPVTTQREQSPRQRAHPMAPLPAIAGPQATPRIEFAASAAVQSPARELPPTIRVTIGRIEVRAVMPPSPPAPGSTSARPGPALSLDAYLQQRSGGKL
jgi:hypothetical protein